MAMKGAMRHKKYIGKNVFDAALERMNYLFDCYDNVHISFSGGKDSTAVLQIALMVAEERGKLPLNVHFFDEEAIPWECIDYVKRVADDPRINLTWFCLPIQHRNAASNDETYWYCWDPRHKDKWCRPLPVEYNPITEHPKFKWGMSHHEFADEYIVGNVALCLGIRTEESVRRYQVIAMKANDSYISRGKFCTKAYPIYDWSSVDVWKLVELTGCDYNRAYDLMHMTEREHNFLGMRMCQPWGEEPLRGLPAFKELYPELWNKMVDRVPGCATAGLYANTELYSGLKKPEGQTWREYMLINLESYQEPEIKNEVKKIINNYIRIHYEQTDDELHDELNHPLSGMSWKFLAMISIKGDLKDRQRNKLGYQAQDRLKKLGLTEEQAKKIYGKRKSAD